MGKSMKCFFSVVLTFLSVTSNAEKIMGVEAPGCVGKEALNASDAKCIALFYGQFISTVGSLGGEWDVKPIKKESDWYIYPTKVNSFVQLDTLLYKINSNTGEISEFLPKP